MKVHQTKNILSLINQHLAVRTSGIKVLETKQVPQPGSLREGVFNNPSDKQGFQAS